MSPAHRSPNDTLDEQRRDDPLVASPADASELRDRLVLIVISASDAGKVYAIETSLRLGRDPTCEVSIDDPAVSRLHATVRPLTGEGAPAEVVDGGSRNGTFVNGQRVRGAHPLRDGDRLQVGPHAQFRFAATDTAEEQLLRKLYESSARDPLTGSANQRHLLERIGDELAYAQRHGGAVSLLLFDVAALGRINARHGYLTGDRLLQDVARSMRNTVRREDLVARWGGGTFAVLARGIGSEGAAKLAERIRVQVAGLRVEHEGAGVAFHVHVGLAICDMGATDRTIEALTRGAVASLERAKGRSAP